MCQIIVGGGIIEGSGKFLKIEIIVGGGIIVGSGKFVKSFGFTVHDDGIIVEYKTWYRDRYTFTKIQNTVLSLIDTHCALQLARMRVYFRQRQPK